MITPMQIRAARLFLGWEQKDLANAAGLSLPTIQRMEKLGLERSSAGNAEKVRTALEAAGIDFIPAGASSATGGEGVRLKVVRSMEPAPE